MTDSGPRPVAAFGKRRPAAGGGPGGAATGPSGARGKIASVREERIVPTRLAPILLAGLALLAMELTVGALAGVLAPVPPGAVSHHRDFDARDVATLFVNRAIILPLLLTLVYQACHLAAIYSMAAHFVLRWLKFTSLAAYAVGGLCAAFVVVSFWSVEGDKPELATCAIEILGGGLAGLFYRLFAGAMPAADGAGQARFEGFGPSPQSAGD
jgi:hypothetical protein